MIKRLLEIELTYNSPDFSEATEKDILNIIRTEPETIINSLIEIIDRLED